MLPADDADALDWLAFEQAGVLTTAQVAGLLSEGAVRGRIRTGRWRSIGQTVGDIAGGAQALSEIDFLRLCRRHWLPAPDLQEHRVDAAGRNRWLDAYWRKWRVQVEVDGAHHMDARQWAADMRRQNDVWTSGDRILRFPAWLVRARRTRSPTPSAALS
ncbi:hypothetical protein [Micromonospora parva]|uniref:hypothetical protein n=1 Tax=Micromonospora parva TaxID=1464048 RepID=UPI0033C65DF8